MVVNLLTHKKKDHGDKEKKIAKIVKPGILDCQSQLNKNPISLEPLYRNEQTCIRYGGN